jgi:hypothetical protein
VKAAPLIALAVAGLLAAPAVSFAQVIKERKDVFKPKPQAEKPAPPPAQQPPTAAGKAATPPTAAEKEARGKGKGWAKGHGKGQGKKKGYYGKAMEKKKSASE